MNELEKLVLSLGRLAEDARMNAKAYENDGLNHANHVKEFGKYQAFTQAHGLAKDALNKARGYA